MTRAALGAATVHARKPDRSNRSPATILVDVAADPDAAWWPAVVEDLQDVIDESDGDLSLELIGERLAANAARLWLVVAAGRHAGVVVEERSDRWLHLVAVRLRYNHLLAQVLRFFGGVAAESGLRLMASSRRPGAARLLARYGWRPRFVEYIAPEPVEVECPAPK